MPTELSGTAPFPVPSSLPSSLPTLDGSHLAQQQWLQPKDWLHAFPHIPTWHYYDDKLAHDVLASLCAARLGQAPTHAIVEQPWQAQWLTQQCMAYMVESGIAAAPLPRVMTLGQWITLTLKQQGVEDDQVITDRQAALSLCDALKGLNIASVSSDSARYALASDMVALLKEMDTRALLSPALGFAGQQAATRLGHTPWLSREAQWLAVAREHLETAGKPLAWQARLNACKLVASDPRIVCVLPAPHPNLVMQVFLSCLTAPNRQQTTDLAATLAVCLPRLNLVDDNVQRLISTSSANANLNANLNVTQCEQFEHEAVVATQLIQAQMNLANSQRSVIVVAHDRVLARRVGALLARHSVPVEDRVGWALSTTVSATVLRGLLSSWMSSDVPALMSWLALPVIAAHWPAARATGAYLRNRWQQQNIIPEGREFMRRALESAPDENVRHGLQHWRDGQQFFSKPNTVAGFAIALSKHCQPIAAALEQDAAGAKVWQHLQTLALEIDTTQHSVATFVAVLDQVLESERFSASTQSYQDPSAARAIFVPLYEAAWTDNTSVVMLGCNEAHFPAVPRSPTPLLNSVRRELGLPMPSAEPAVWQHLLAQSNKTIHATFTPNEQGNPSRLSPYLLGAPVQLAQCIQAAEVHTAREDTLTQAVQASQAASLAVATLPTEVSVTKLATVLQCPYRFALQTVFGIRPAPQPALWPSQLERGNVLHEALHQVKDQLTQISGNPAQLDTTIHAALHRLLQDKIKLSGRYAALVADSGRTVATYVSAHAARQAEGWRLLAAEHEVESQHLIANVRVHGKIDRLDVIRDSTGQPQGYAVLDYKTSSDSVLKNKRDTPLEDAQLALYAALIEQLDMPAAQAAYWRLHDGLLNMASDGGATKSAETAIYHTKKTWFDLKNLPNDIDDVTDAVRFAWNKLDTSSTAPATPSESACQYCHYKAVCRSSDLVKHDGEGNDQSLNGEGAAHD